MCEDFLIIPQYFRKPELFINIQLKHQIHDKVSDNFSTQPSPGLGSQNIHISCLQPSIGVIANRDQSHCAFTVSKTAFGYSNDAVRREYDT